MLLKIEQIAVTCFYTASTSARILSVSTYTLALAKTRFICMAQCHATHHTALETF